MYWNHQTSGFSATKHSTTAWRYKTSLLFLLHRQKCTPVQPWTPVGQERQIEQAAQSPSWKIVISKAFFFFLRQKPQAVISNTKSALEILIEGQALKQASSSLQNTINTLWHYTVTHVLCIHNINPLVEFLHSWLYMHLWGQRSLAQLIFGLISPMTKWFPTICIVCAFSI